MAKTADEARAAAMKSKRGLPKGGGKGLKGSNLYTPVSQATIDSIKKAGMAASLKKAATSKDASFVQGVKRMYGAERLATAKKAAVIKSPSADSARGSVRTAKPVTRSADAARAGATRTGASTVMAKPKAATVATKKGPTSGLGKFIARGISNLDANNRTSAAKVAAERKRREAAAKKNK